MHMASLTLQTSPQNASRPKLNSRTFVLLLYHLKLLNGVPYRVWEVHMTLLQELRHISAVLPKLATLGQVGVGLPRLSRLFGLRPAHALHPSSHRLLLVPKKLLSSLQQGEVINTGKPFQLASLLC